MLITSTSIIINDPANDDIYQNSRPNKSGMNYLTLSPFDIRQYIYSEYLCVPKQLSYFWSKLPAFAKCRSNINVAFDVYELVAVAQYFITAGYLPLIKWMHSRGYSYKDEAVDCAAITGQLAILQWLLDNTEGKITCRTMARVVIYGQLEILQFLTQQGSSIPYDTWDLASASGHKHILQWLTELKPVQDV